MPAPVQGNSRPTSSGHARAGSQPGIVRRWCSSCRPGRNVCRCGSGSFLLTIQPGILFFPEVTERGNPAQLLVTREAGSPLPETRRHFNVRKHPYHPGKLGVNRSLIRVDDRPVLPDRRPSLLCLHLVSRAGRTLSYPRRNPCTPSSPLLVVVETDQLLPDQCVGLGRRRFETGRDIFSDAAEVDVVVVSLFLLRRNARIFRPMGRIFGIDISGLVPAIRRIWREKMTNFDFSE